MKVRVQILAVTEVGHPSHSPSVEDKLAQQQREDKCKKVAHRIVVGVKTGHYRITLTGFGTTFNSTQHALTPHSESIYSADYPPWNGEMNASLRVG